MSAHFACTCATSRQSDGFTDSHYLERLHEAKQGYFHDYNQARTARGGKLWIAPNVLIREDVCTFHRPLVSSRSLILTGENRKQTTSPTSLVNPSWGRMSTRQTCSKAKQRL